MDHAHMVPIVGFILISGLVTVVLLSRRTDRNSEDERKIADLVHTALTSKLNGKIEDARALLERALLMLDRESRPPFGLLTATLLNLAQCLGRSGDLEGANQLYKRLLELWRQVLRNPQPSDLIDIDYAAASSDFGWSTSDVADLYSDVVAEKRRIYGPVHHEVVNSLVIKAKLLKLIGRSEEAEAVEAELEQLKERLR